MAMIGALETVTFDDHPRFLIKGGVSIELRLGLLARTTRDVDAVFRGSSDELADALDEAFEQPYSNFSFRRKGEIERIRDTNSRRLAVQVSFGNRDWQTLQLEIGPPEADEAELVPVAIGIEDFKLSGPRRVACLSLRYQVAQKLHAVTEQPDGRENQRFWDLMDLILLRTLLENLTPVRDACVAVFTARGTHEWPPPLVVPAAWAEPYARVATEHDFPITDVYNAAEQVRELIASIDAPARVRGAAVHAQDS
jgi:Nucleotidyl transferase AbiEii toxin, Type IV TA system